MTNLSDRQQRILEFIRDYLAEHNYPPTIREIGAAAGISSTSVVNYNLDRLVTYGLLERDPKSSRSMRLLHEPMDVAISSLACTFHYMGKLLPAHRFSVPASVRASWPTKRSNSRATSYESRTTCMPCRSAAIR